MDREFTLRLKDVEDKKLPNLKKLTGKNTDSGAIKACIRSFEELNKKYNKEVELSKQLREQNAILKNKTANFFMAFKELKKEV